MWIGRPVRLYRVRGSGLIRANICVEGPLGAWSHITLWMITSTC